MEKKDEICTGCLQLPGRRAVLKAALGVGVGVLWSNLAAAQHTDPRQARPQEGDRFVFPFGNRKGEMITPEDLPLGGPPLLAYPMEPRTKVIRDGSRLNQVVLVRLDAAELAEETRAHAAAGIVAYSAVCTHQGCPVTEWQNEKQVLKCPCHYSEFDPKDGARVLSGPARRRLATLPLKLTNGLLVAAGGFAGRVGYKRR